MERAAIASQGTPIFVTRVQARIDIPNLLKMYEVGKIKLDELVTRTYTLDQVNEAYADLIEGRIIRGVIEFE